MRYLPLLLLASAATLADEKNPAAPARYALNRDGTTAAPRLVAKDVCAWPALTRLPDGTILAAIFNQPSHGRMQGDVDIWASTDHGATWRKRSTGAPRTPGVKNNRMNVAFGALPDGAVILLASGWSLKDDAKNPTGLEIDQILPPWICRSADGGRTWTIDRESFPRKSPGGLAHVPFGPIMAGRDGDLLAPLYDTTGDPATGRSTWNSVRIYRSRDGGRTWGEPAPLDPRTRTNETALLHLGAGRWLAFGRMAELTAFESTDDGRTWTKLGPASPRHGLPGNAILLADGRVLLSYGNRTSGDPRVEARVSADGGRTWSEPARLADATPAPNKGLEDMGYPSSVLLDDGRVVTGYYARRTRLHDGYQFSAVTWDPARTFGARR